MQERQSFSSTIAPYITEGIRIILGLFLIAAGVIFLSHLILAIDFKYPLDYGEAPLIDHARRLLAGENIYSKDISTPPFTITNYPPLYILSLIPFINLPISPFSAGRVISGISAILSAVFLGLTVHSLTKSRLAAWTTSAVFFAIPYVVQWSGLARIDHLALMLSTAALYIVVCWADRKWNPYLAGLLLVAAIFTRQSYALAAPLAAFIWTWTQDRKKAVTLALFTAGVGLIVFVILNFLTDGGFYFHIVTANVNEFGWDRVKDRLSDLWSTMYIALLFGLILLLFFLKRVPGWMLIAPYLVGASLSTLTIGKIGSNVNYFLEISAALSLVIGLLVAWGLKQTWWLQLGIVFFVILQSGLLLRETMNNPVERGLVPHRSDWDNIQILETYIKNTEEPILTDEDMGLLTLNGRSIYMQPFEITQLVNAGLLDQDPIINQIQQGSFKAILIHHFGSYPVYKERWTPAMLENISKYYTPKFTMAGTVVYEPAQIQTVSPVQIPSAPGSETNIGAPTIGPVLPIGKSEYVALPYIAVNPVNPDFLSAIVTTASKFECELPTCKVSLTLYTSSDGGNTWSNQTPFSLGPQPAYNGIVAFTPAGDLFVMGIRGDTVTINSTTEANGYVMNPGNQEEITRVQVAAKPWFRIDPVSGDLYITLDAQERSTYVTPAMIQSMDGGKHWTNVSRTDQRVSINDMQTGRANGPDDIQVLISEDRTLSLIWSWEPAPWSWPKTVWMSVSPDNGETFSEPSPILESWGSVNSATNGQLEAIAYKAGTEADPVLAVAVTKDHGTTWTSTAISGQIPLGFDVGKGAGVGVAPDGTIDVVFYAKEGKEVEGCSSTLEDWQNAFWAGQVDNCTYNVFYTFSKDEGVTFSAPVQLNTAPINGSDFLRFNGESVATTHLAVASTNDHAFPIWIGTPGSTNTQAFTIAIER